MIQQPMVPVQVKQQKSTLKNSNPKIGRPAKTDQQQQFKNHYLQNRKKFQLQCELLVYIHQIFFQEIPTHPTNAKVDISEVVKLFQQYDCMEVFRILAKLNELYYKSSSLFPEEKLRYTSLIDIGYLMRQIKIERSQKISSYELCLLVLFFLYNERVVNADFFNFFKKRVEIFRNGMINGPEHCELNKMDTLIITLGLEVAIREGMLIEEEVQMEDGDEEDPSSPAAGGVKEEEEEEVSEERPVSSMESESPEDKLQ